MAPSLAAFHSVEAVGLTEGCGSTAGEAHGAPMELAPLRSLRRLRRLQLERGIVDLAALPPQVQQLTLVEIDRLMVPPVPGTSIADRLLAAAETHGALAGAATFQLHACPPGVAIPVQQRIPSSVHVCADCTTLPAPALRCPLQACSCSLCGLSLAASFSRKPTGRR